MSSFRPRPSAVSPSFGHPILRAQSCWFVANELSRVTRDILRGPYAAGTLGANVSYGNAAQGRGYLGDASSTSIIDLGSANRFIAGATQPFTISWVEHHSGAQTNAGVVYLMPAGAAANNGFFILRINQGTVGAGNYGRLACGCWGGATNISAFLGPPPITDNTPHVFVITGASGPLGGDLTWSVYWEGGVQINSNGHGNGGTFGGTANNFGWDGADNKWAGILDNLRVWNRVLSKREINWLLADPYVGCVRNKRHFVAYLPAPVAAPGQYRFFLAS